MNKVVRLICNLQKDSEDKDRYSLYPMSCNTIAFTVTGQVKWNNEEERGDCRVTHHFLTRKIINEKVAKNGREESSSAENYCVNIDI